MRAKTIVALGDSTTRIDYNHASLRNGLLSTHFTTDEEGNNYIVITDKRGTSQTTTKIKYVAFKVEDNTTLNLSNDELSDLLDVHQTYQKDTVAVHCNSGVGRTGQFRLLIALLDQHKYNKPFADACDNILNAISLNIIISSDRAMNHTEISELKNKFDFIYQTINEVLFNLRKTRYCIQSEEQFTNTLPQFLLLLATQKEFNAEYLDKLREQLSITPQAEKEPLSRVASIASARSEGADSDDDDLPPGHNSFTGLERDKSDLRTAAFFRKEPTELPRVRIEKVGSEVSSAISSGNPSTNSSPNGSRTPTPATSPIFPRNSARFPRQSSAVRFAEELLSPPSAGMNPSK